MSASTVLLTIGALLVIAGVAILVYEIRSPLHKKPNFQSFDDAILINYFKLRLRTTRVGVIVIAIGAALLLVGAFFEK